MRQQRVSDQIVGDGQYAVVLDQVVQQVFRDVPSGGDAAFARAFCQMRGWAPDLINGSFLTLSTGFGVPGSEVFGRTPHLLRGIGRHECSAAEQGGADWIEAQATLDAEVFEARADPAQYKQSLLAQIDDSPGLRRELAAAKREKILAASPESLVDRLQMTSSVGRLAIDYQCPHLQQ
ncbi:MULTISPECIES: hypothetical protein [Gordonia]|uniref:hypothetical protein n=1 Tax=Gordonia TaxID=2053 RepID=UPI001182E47C|nr:MULTISPECIES: hypothetical protein [Gordonia]